MLTAIAKLLIGAPIVIIIKALWPILLAFFLVVALCSWWRRHLRATIGTGVFMVSGTALIFALMNDCRYPYRQWQSTGLDLLTTIGGFWLGMIIARAVNPQTESQTNGAQGTLWWKVPLLLAIGLIVATGLVLANETPNNLVIFIWALGLPILGAAAKRRWPGIF